MRISSGFLAASPLMPSEANAEFPLKPFCTTKSNFTSIKDHSKIIGKDQAQHLNKVIKWELNWLY